MRVDAIKLSPDALLFLHHCLTFLIFLNNIDYSFKFQHSAGLIVSIDSDFGPKLLLSNDID